MKAMVHSPDGYNKFFNIVAEAFQENTSTQILILICQDSIQRISIDLMKENSFAQNS